MIIKDGLVCRITGWELDRCIQVKSGSGDLDAPDDDIAQHWNNV